MELHVDILHKDGKPEFAVIPYQEYLDLQILLADAQDLIELREAKLAEGEFVSIDLQQAKKELGL